MHIYAIREGILEKAASELMGTGLMGGSEQLRPESLSCNTAIMSLEHTAVSLSTKPNKFASSL